MRVIHLTVSSYSALRSFSGESITSFTRSENAPSTQAHSCVSMRTDTGFLLFIIKLLRPQPVRSQNRRQEARGFAPDNMEYVTKKTQHTQTIKQTHTHTYEVSFLVT